MRLIDADQLTDVVNRSYLTQGEKRLFNIKIRHAPTVKTYCYFCGQTEHGQVVPDNLQGWKYEERPQCEWIYTPNIIGLSEYEGITCSICGDDSVGDFNFCPNCGAKMQKGGAE